MGGAMPVVVNSAYRLSNQWQIAPELLRGSYYEKTYWALGLFWIALIYWGFPDIRPSWSSDTAGLLVTAVFFLIVVSVVFLTAMIVLPAYLSLVAIIIFAFRTKLRPKPVEVTVSEMGIKIADPMGSHSLLAWGDLKRVVEYDRAIVLRSRFVLSIPKDDFTDDLFATRRIANDKLGSRAKMKTSS